MSLQWTLVAGFLYVEIAVVALFLLPFVSAKRWNSLFKSRFLKAIEGQMFFYFCVLILVLVLLFLDALREMRKYDDNFDPKDYAHGHLDMEIQNHMRLFRAQRNFYISGFALFLFLVLRRLATLLSHQAMLEATGEAAMRQAVSATKAAEKLLSGGGTGVSEEEDKRVAELKSECERLHAQVESAEKRTDAIKQQAEATNREYDRLMREHETLQRQLAAKTGTSDKKDD